MNRPNESESSREIATEHLGPVEETLMIPLWGRALEQHRRRPILRDPKAEAIVASLDYDFSKFDGLSLRAASLRTRIYDRVVQRWMDEHPTGTVVELGCGLNTRFERIDNGTVRWSDLDVPDVIALWRRFFEETDRRRPIASSAFETDWMNALAAENSGPMLFVSEASTLYFPEAANRQLYRDLAARFPGARVIFDTATRDFVDTQDKHDALRHCTARVTWAVEDETDLAAWAFQDLERFPLFRPARWLRSEVPFAYRVMFAGLALIRPAMSRSYQLNLARLATSPEDAD